MWLPEPTEPTDGTRVRKRTKPADTTDYKQKYFPFEVGQEILARSVFFDKLVWLIDYSVFGAFVYLLSHVWIYVFPGDESLNVSVLWCLFSMAFSLQVSGFKGL